LKRFRALATRFEKTARNYLALLQLACSVLWLRDLLGGA
ncbi:MAG TPA: IS5/IS1182 family transposase, partial [Polyangiaceae bacterium]